jgi:hypothetical protein
LGAPFTRIARVSARVSTPAVEALGRAEAARVGHVLTDDAAQRMRVDRLDILGVRADIADVREGEGDDLARIGGIGHHLLIAGHGRVEADLADGLALGPESPAPDQRAIVQRQYARRPFGLRTRVLGLGHWRALLGWRRSGKRRRT